MADEPQAAPPPPEPEPLPDWVLSVQEAVPDGIRAVLGVPGGAGPADMPTFDVAPERWVEAVGALKAGGCDLFVDLGAADHPDRAERFEVVLHLRDVSAGRLLRCRTAVTEATTLPSLEPLFPAAGWPEREVFDLFGLRFEGNQDMRRLLLPDDWAGHPLRKDYPLTGPRALDPDSPYAH